MAKLSQTLPQMLYLRLIKVYIVFLSLLLLSPSAKGQLEVGWAMGYSHPLGEFSYQNDSENPIGLAKYALSVKFWAGIEIKKKYSIEFIINQMFYRHSKYQTLAMLTNFVDTDQYYMRNDKFYGNVYNLSVIKAGLRKKFWLSNLIIEPGVFIGTGDLSTDMEYGFELKEKGTNYHIRYSIDFHTLNQFPLIVSPHLRFSRNIYQGEFHSVNILCELQYHWFNSSVLQRTETNDMFNNSMLEETQWDVTVQSLDTFLWLNISF